MNANVAQLFLKNGNHLSHQRLFLFWAVNFSPSLAALTHLTVLGRASYTAHMPFFLAFDIICSVISASWLSARFCGTRFSFVSVTLLLSVLISAINWTIFAGGCCQTMG